MTDGMRILTSKKTILGLKPVDMLGILIMIIPFVISFRSFTATEEQIKHIFLFLRNIEITTKRVNIKPNMVSMLCSVAFYGALLTRFALFKTETLFEGIVSSLRTFLNCWVFASLFSMIVPENNIKQLTFHAFLQNHESKFLLMGILFSWIGMRTLSGYSWILFILAAWNNIRVLNEAMGAWGNVIKIKALAEDGKHEEMSTSGTVCSFSREKAWQGGRR